MPGINSDSHVCTHGHAAEESGRRKGGREGKRGEGKEGERRSIGEKQEAPGVCFYLSCSPLSSSYVHVLSMCLRKPLNCFYMLNSVSVTNLRFTAGEDFRPKYK